MRHVPYARNRRLLFRSYLFLAGGLLTAAVLLDLGFGYLETRDGAGTDRWLAATFRLIESRLADTPAGGREAAAAEIAEELGVNIQLMSRDDVHVNAGAEPHLVPLVDAEGNTSYLHEADSIGAVVRLGPIAESGRSPLLNLLPPIFYLSIFVIVGLWLRPMLRDIGLISSGARQFAADYRQPLCTADKTTELTSLAKNIDAMSARLSGVLRNQKELIAALSHEMRTPLARLRFALAVSGEKASNELREKLDAMKVDVQEIDDLIAAMLGYARLDHPDLDMHWQKVPAAAWLDKVIARQSRGGMRIAFDAHNLPDTIRIDPRLMELALSNLLVNALKYGRNQVCCSLVSKGDTYLLAVEDDGPGIPEDAREQVFKAFSRIDDSRSRETGGYGLGLAVVARVAELHQGSVGVDASPTLGGARFTVAWPAVQETRDDGSP